MIAVSFVQQKITFNIPQVSSGTELSFHYYIYTTLHFIRPRRADLATRKVLKGPNAVCSGIYNQHLYKTLLRSKPNTSNCYAPCL